MYILKLSFGNCTRIQSMTEGGPTQSLCWNQSHSTTSLPPPHLATSRASSGATNQWNASHPLTMEPRPRARLATWLFNKKGHLNPSHSSLPYHFSKQFIRRRKSSMFYSSWFPKHQELVVTSEFHTPVLDHVNQLQIHTVILCYWLLRWLLSPSSNNHSFPGKDL